MIKVFWKNYPKVKPNAKLGGRYFINGVYETEDIEEGKHLAELFHLEYEVEKVKKATKKTPTKKKVSK